MAGFLNTLGGIGAVIGGAADTYSILQDRAKRVALMQQQLDQEKQQLQAIGAFAGGFGGGRGGGGPPQLGGAPQLGVPPQPQQPPMPGQASVPMGRPTPLLPPGGAGSGGGAPAPSMGGAGPSSADAILRPPGSIPPGGQALLADMNRNVPQGGALDAPGGSGMAPPSGGGVGGPPQPMAPGGAPAGSGGPQPQGYLSMDDIADRIRQNYQAKMGKEIDDVTLGMAMIKALPFMERQDQMLITQAYRQSQIDAKRAADEGRLERGREHDEVMKAIAAGRNATNVYIAQGHDTTHLEGIDRQQTGASQRQADRLFAAAQDKAQTREQKAVLSQYQLDTRQLAIISSAVNAHVAAQHDPKDFPEMKALMAKRDALAERLTETQRKNPFLPRPSEAVKAIQADESAGSSAGGAGPAAPASAVAPQSAAPAGGGPKVGDVQDGYRFKGGNPADQSSWERVQ